MGTRRILRPVLGASTQEQGGAVLVETALGLTLLLVLAFGIVEAAAAYQSATVASNASRAGARLGSSRFATDPAVSEGVRLAVEEALADRPSSARPVSMRIYKASTDGGSSCLSRCLRYVWNVGTSRFVADPTSPGWVDPDGCGSVLDSLGVSVEMRHTASNSLVPLSVTIEERTVMRIEPRDASQCAHGET